MWGVLIFLRFYYIAASFHRSTELKRRLTWLQNGRKPCRNGRFSRQRLHNATIPRPDAQVGQAGIWQTLLAVLLSFLAAFCTTAAMSSIASSGGLVSSGGPYYMISRALGDEIIDVNKESRTYLYTYIYIVSKKIYNM